MKESIRHCLDQMDDEFNTMQFAECLKKNGSLKKISPKFAFKYLKSLEQKNLIKKIGKATYRKELSIEADPLDITIDFIRKCKQENKLQFWEYGGFISTAAQFITLGIPENKSRPDVIQKFLELLLNRQAEIYKAIEDLLIYDYKSPSLLSEYPRQVILELIPYLLDHNHLDSQELLKEVDRLIQSIPYSDGLDEINDHLRAFTQSQENLSKDVLYPKKIGKKLVMISIPNDWTLDENYAKRKLVRYVQNAFKKEISIETIIFELANFWEQDIVWDTLSELKYLSKDKINAVRRYYLEFRLGRKVLPYFDDIDYCLKVINQLDSGEKKRGWYIDPILLNPDSEGIEGKINRMESDEVKKNDDVHLGKEKPDDAYDLFDTPNISKILGKVRSKSTTLYEIKSKSYYKNLLRKRIESLSEIVKGTDMDKAVKAAAFTLSYKLPQDTLYLRERFEISKGLSYSGLHIDEEQIQSSFQRGVEQGKRFIQKALKERSKITING